MFGLSPNKILFTALIVAAVWYGFKWLNRLQSEQKNKARQQNRDQRSQAAKANSTEVDYEELVACPECGDYVVADKKHSCGKDACPYDN